MSDYERIYLQPECCAGDEGRLWCQDDEPETCPDGEKWTPYILLSEYEALRAQLEQERARVAELEKQEAVLQLSELMRGLEIGPGFASMPPYIFYVTGKHIADQAKHASDAAILRKQAEAVEHQVKIERDHFGSCAPCLTRMQNRAQWLRNQADEAEKAGGGQ